MFLSFFILFGFLWEKIGSPLQIIENLPKNFTDPLGGNTVQYVLVWFFIAAWTFIDPGFFQRCAAAKTPEIAKKGILIAIGFWAIFDTLTLFCGLYAINYLKTDQALLTYPLLAINILPVGFLGLFMTGIFAIIMSTIDSLSFISAITFGRDILWRLNHKPEDKKSIIPFIKTGLIFISTISLTLAYLIPSVVGLLFTLGSIIIPALILPFIVSLIVKDFNLPEKLSIQWILIPLFISFLWLLLSKTQGLIFLKIEPFYPGMIGSFLYYFIIIRGHQWQLK
jgi:SSS family solute:Na+ symporter